jgi:hypothetical protein
MGKDYMRVIHLRKNYLKKANEILGFRITDMFELLEELKETKVTQPAFFYTCNFFKTLKILNQKW